MSREDYNRVKGMDFDTPEVGQALSVIAKDLEHWLKRNAEVLNCPLFKVSGETILPKTGFLFSFGQIRNWIAQLREVSIGIAITARREAAKEKANGS